MAAGPARFGVLPPLEEWDIDLEVSGSVYLLPKGIKLLQRVNLWPGTTSSSHMGGFKTAFKETLPQVVMAPYFL